MLPARTSSGRPRTPLLLLTETPLLSDSISYADKHLKIVLCAEIEQKQYLLPRSLRTAGKQNIKWSPYQFLELLRSHWHCKETLSMSLRLDWLELGQKFRHSRLTHGSAHPVQQFACKLSSASDTGISVHALYLSQLESSQIHEIADFIPR